MTDQTPALSPEQLETLRVFQRIRMTWIMFYFVLSIFVIAFGLLIFSVFSPRFSGWVQIGFFLFNGVLGASTTSIVKNLFP